MVCRKFLRKTAGIGALATLGLGLPITSQNAEADFFDGHRGPGGVQVDQRVFHVDDFSTATFYRVFGEDRSSIDPGFIVKAFTSDGEPTGYGFNVIGLIDDPFGHGKNLRMISGVQVDKKLKSGDTTISPSFASTIKLGKENLLTIDPRASYIINLDGEDDFSYACTVGLGSKRFRVGVDFKDSLNGELEYMGVIRIDKIDGDGFPKYWWQGYVGRDKVGVGFRYNWK